MRVLKTYIKHLSNSLPHCKSMQNNITLHTIAIVTKVTSSKHNQQCIAITGFISIDKDYHRFRHASCYAYCICVDKNQHSTCSQQQSAAANFQSVACLKWRE